MAPPTISLPTRRHRDTGIVLLFLSLVCYYVLPLLAYEFGYSHGACSLISTPLGLLLMALGLAMIFLSRKTIRVEGSTVRIQDGFLTRALALRLESTPTIKLSVYEEHHRGRVDEIWTVHLIDEGRQYLIDRRTGQHIAVRSLAERLAKATQGSLIEVHDGKAHRFELSELDLPFTARVARYPALMGHAVDQPEDLVVGFDRQSSGIEVSWSFFRSALFWELLLVAAALVGAAFIPLPGGPDGQGFTLYEIEKAEQDYRYFAAVAAFTVLALATLLGYRTTIRLDAQGAQARSTVWGIPVRGGSIPLEQLEHVGVSWTSRGPYLLLISDHRILKEMMPSAPIGRWVAWQMRDFLAQLPSSAADRQEGFDIPSSN